MKKAKVLMVHNYYKIGGGEHTVFENEKKMLRDNGHEVIEYTRDNREINGFTSKCLTALNTIFNVKTYFEIRKLILKNDVDVVHCHNTFPIISPAVYYAARSLKIPVIQTIHNFRLLCPAGVFYCKGEKCEICNKNNTFKYALKNKCYRNSKVQTLVVVSMLKIHRWLNTYKKISYIFLTEFNKEKFKNIIDINSENIYVKSNFVNEIKVNKNNKNDEIKFVFAGRLEENKGIKFLVDSWDKLPYKYELHIYGDGALKDYVINSTKVLQNIKYFGFQPQSEIFNDLVSSKALLFPSDWYETFGMILAESFSIGIPVITTNIGNQKLFIEKSKAGSTFQFNNIDSLQNAINDVIENFDKYSLNAKKYYDSYLNEESNYRKLVEIYESAKHIS